MAHIANNADDYANARVGIYFPAKSGAGLADGDLTGQCVSLDKWFLNEMTDVPNPGAARGNAKDFGDTLVAQGQAKVVTSPQRGDIAVWKKDGGGYGHTGIVLSGNRVFEQNAALPGRASKIVDGARVYASGIDPLTASWRVGSPTFYRVNSYKEITPAPADGGLKAVNGTATVTVAKLNVRSQPTTSAPLAGSKTLTKGQSFKYVGFIVANGYVWLKSSVGNYVAEGPNDGNPNNVYVSGGVS